MKKKDCLVLSLVAAALAVLPVSSALAATTVTDTLSITVSNSANLTATRSNGDGSWSSSTCSVTMSVSSSKTNICSNKLTITANYVAGYKVTIATTALTHTGSSSLTIPYSVSYSTSSTGWAASKVNTGAGTTNGYANGAVVSSSNGGQVNGTNVTIYYGAAINGTQAAGTYTGTGASYTLAAYS